MRHRNAGYKLVFSDEPPDPPAIILIPKEVALKRVCVAVRLSSSVTVSLTE